MNKKIVALAVASALAAPLAAQAEVKVSGTLQAEIINLSGDGVVEGLYFTDAQEGGNPGSGNAGEIAFSASEDLGGGLKAIAKYGINVEAGRSRPYDARDAYVGLSGGFGTVLAGRLSSPYKSSTVKWDPFLATSFQARGNGGMSGLHNGYVDNVLAYANKFGTATVVAAIAIDESPNAAGTETNADHPITASVTAPVGPVELAFGYIDLGVSDTTAMKIGVKWTSGAISVAAQHEMLDSGLAGQVVQGAGDSTVTYVAAGYDMGANKISASFGVTSPDIGDDTTQFAIGASHSFSKTTSAYVGYSVTDLDTAGDYSAFGAGMRVSF